MSQLQLPAKIGRPAPYVGLQHRIFLTNKKFQVESSERSIYSNRPNKELETKVQSFAEIYKRDGHTVLRREHEGDSDAQSKRIRAAFLESRDLMQTISHNETLAYDAHIERIVLSKF